MSACPDCLKLENELAALREEVEAGYVVRDDLERERDDARRALEQARALLAEGLGGKEHRITSWSEWQAGWERWAANARAFLAGGRGEKP